MHLVDALLNNDVVEISGAKDLAQDRIKLWQFVCIDNFLDKCGILLLVSAVSNS
jgi:hypothetical protein